MTVYPLWRNPFSLNYFLRHTSADADGHRGTGAAARVRERGESDAGALSGAAARNCDSNVVGREPLAAGAATACGESAAVAGGRRGGAADHVLDGGNVDEICAGDGFSDLAGGAADRSVLLATVVISVLTGVIFGILPALRASGVAPVTVLKEDSGSASGGLRKARLASGLVVAQISLSLVLLVCAGLFIRSFLSAQKIDLGFNPHNVLIASYDLFTAGYSKEKGRNSIGSWWRNWKRCREYSRCRSTNRLPGLSPGSTSVKPEGYVSKANESMETPMAIVTPKYFQTMQIPLVKGRDFTPQDNKNSQRAVIVSEAFANRYWPRQEALGKQLNSDLTHEWFTVVGVARDSKMTSLSEKPAPFLYLPFYQVYRGTMIVTARVSGDPLTFGKTVEKTIHELNSDLVVFDVTSLELSEHVASFPQHIAGTFVGAFGLLALVLAAMGIYGVTAYTTRQRTHEIGIRMALGASKEDILRLVLGHGLRLTFIGVALGLAASFALTRYLSSLLLGVTSTDALTFSTWPYCCARWRCSRASFLHDARCAWTLW